jgi:hypothetical protein
LIFVLSNRYRRHQAERNNKHKSGSNQEGTHNGDQSFSTKQYKKSQSLLHTYRDDDCALNERKAFESLAAYSSYPPKINKNIHSDLDKMFSISMEKTPSVLENMNLSEELVKSKED